MQTRLQTTVHHNYKHRRRRRMPAPAGQKQKQKQQQQQQQEISTTSCHTSNQSNAFFKPTLILLTISTLLCIAFVPNNTSFAQRLRQQGSLDFAPGHDLSDFHPSELDPVDQKLYQVKAVDPTNPGQKFVYHMNHMKPSQFFRIDENTGELFLTRPIDRETTPSEVLNIFAYYDDDGNRAPKRLSQLISFEDVDDSAPVFQPHKHSPSGTNLPLYQVRISESAPLASMVISEIIVTDADEGPNAEMVFECRPKLSRNFACDVFSIESRRLTSSSQSNQGGSKYSVSIRTKTALDYEHVQSYKLALIARGRFPSKLTGLPLETEAYVDIDVINVQDEGPIFINAPYSVSVREGLPTGEKLLNILVQDGDAAPQRKVDMMIVPGSFSDFFQLKRDEDEKLWYLETNTTIDRESPLVSGANNILTIQLLAVELNDEGAAVASDAEINAAGFEPVYNKATLRRENVTIVVLDVPDSRPVFVRASTGEPIMEGVFEHNVSESIETGSSVPNLDLAVYDLDQSINSRFNLSLVDVDIEPLASNVFALESETIYGRSEIVLSVLNASLLDYENPITRSYRFNLVASKRGFGDSPALAQELQLRINIMDANDNSPEFDRDQYVVEVPEDAKPGTLVATIRAKDRDSGIYGRVEHSLSGLNGFETSKFKLHPIEGRIIVADCGVAQCLDHEVQSSYSLNYEARDGGGQSRNASVIINIIDINDNPPKFSESIYRRELISDNLSSKHNYITPQLIVRAKDADGPSQGRNNITYRIRNSNLTSLDVDPVSGLVYLASPIDLIGIMSSRADKRILFEAEVVAEDNGSPALSSSARIQLILKGNRDGAPVFQQEVYQAVVRESQPKGKTFFKVQATDPDDKDSQLRYSLGDDLNDIVFVHPTTGELSFKTKVDYDDFKSLNPYNVTVYATDNSKPYPLRTSTIVRIDIQDVNNKAPKFEDGEYKTTLIQGHNKVGDNVLTLQADDPDKSANLNYSLLIDELKLTDRNGQSFNLSELMTANEGYLSQISKANRAQLVDSLKKSFKVNKQTGAVILSGQLDYSLISSMSIPAHVVDLGQELDKATPQQQQQQEAFVICTFLLQTYIDHNPVFAPPWTVDKREYQISIMEEMSLGSSIYSLLARDPQTNNRIETFEKVYESDPKDFFRVDKTGVVMINKRIDYEELPAPKRFNLTVKALTEEAHYSLAHLIIQVVDLNDNAPQFKSPNYFVSISESTIYPKEIITVKAEDRDSSSFGQVYYYLGGGGSSSNDSLFSIDQLKGTISVRKGVTLDRDTDPFHVILVTASDCNNEHSLRPSAEPHPSTIASEKPALAENLSYCRKTSTIVNVSLIDENDNDPVFSNVNKLGQIEVLTSETVSVSSMIARVVATDSDEGPNGQVNYEIVREDNRVSKSIRIDSDGIVTVVESLAGLGRSTPYRVSVRAFDGGKSVSRQSFATILLRIEDVVANDGVPQFIRPRADEIVYLSENAAPKSFVYQVQAVDYDEEANGTVLYKLSPASDTFEIDPFHGVITVQARPKMILDRELVPNYTLIVVAHDLGIPPKQSHQILTIRLTDVNDNEPFFDRGIDDPPMQILVEEEIGSDSLIGTIRAIDKDEGQNALIGYEIIEGNQNNMFRLEYDNPNNGSSEGNNACRVYATGRLDRETRESYTLTIKAVSVSKLRHSFLQQSFRDPLGGRNPFNQYNATDLSKIRVSIKLIDVNDNRPSFGQNQLIKSVVDSSAEVYSQLMVFQATDLDSSSSRIHYSILDVLYYSDAKLRFSDDQTSSLGGRYSIAASSNSIAEPISMSHVFDMDPWTGILRNSASLRTYIDGYFEIFVKADSGQQQTTSAPIRSRHTARNASPESFPRRDDDQKCSPQTTSNSSGFDQLDASQKASSSPFANLENCSVAVAKAIVFVTHQRETFRFVFNKTKLNDRLDEFKKRVQDALDDLMYGSSSSGRVAASTALGHASGGLDLPPKAERLFLNTFNTDFYERNDGSLDFSTLTSCSQLVKFDERPHGADDSYGSPSSRALLAGNSVGGGSLNQVINYEDVLKLLSKLNTTESRNQKSSLFEQYGVVNIGRCVSDKTLHKMTPAERAAIYFAIMIAVVGLILAFIVSRMRKNYERNLRILQRSKYQYMSPRGLM